MTYGGERVQFLDQQQVSAVVRILETYRTAIQRTEVITREKIVEGF